MVRQYPPVSFSRSITRKSRSLSAAANARLVIPPPTIRNLVCFMSFGLLVRSALDLEQLDVEYERPRRSAWTLGRLTVRQVCRDPDATLLAFDHQHQRLGPTGDHLVDAERDRLAAHDRTVEHFSILGPAR